MKSKYSLISIALFTSYSVCAAQPWQPVHSEAPQADNVITVSAPASSPLLFVTSPKLPRQPVPASDGADYLKTIPGFDVVRNGGTNGDPVFRGMSDSRLRILTNGAELLGACPNRMDAPTSYISPEEFDSLTVIKGPETVLWGPGNSAGTVLFDRQPPDFEKMGVQGAVTALGGSSDRYDGSADISAGSSLGYLRFTGSTSRASDYKDGNGHRVSSSWDKWNTDVALGFTPGDNNRFVITAGTGDGQAAYAGRNMDGSVFRRKSLGFTFALDDLGETFNKLEGQVNYNYAYHVMDNYTLRYNAKPPKMWSAMPFDRRTISGRVMGTWQWQTVKLEAGIDGETYTHRGIPGMKYHPRIEARPGFIKDARYAGYGAFAQADWKLNDDNKLIGGARVDHSDMTNNKDHRRQATFPAGFLRLEHDVANTPAMFYVGVGHVERFPDYWELFSNDNDKGMITPYLADPFDKLKSEKTTQLDIGAQYKTEKLTVWVSGYAGYINDFILFTFQKNNMMKNYRAVGNVNARIMGAEAGVNYNLTEHWKTDASLSYAYGQNISESRPLPQMSPLQANFSASYEYHGLSATALWRVVSKQNRVALHEGTLIGQDMDTTPGFGIISANAAYKFNNNVQLSAGVDNLFNKVYSEHSNAAGAGPVGYTDDHWLNEPGRTYWAKLNVTF